MNDTSPDVARRILERFDAMTLEERYALVVSMRRTAIALIASSLPSGLTREQRRYLLAKRMYGEELPEAALRAHANHPEEQGA
jgi:hypothetical protein